MKKTIRLTEYELVTLIENIVRENMLSEQRSDYAIDRQSNALLRSTGIRSDADYKQVNKIITKAEQTLLNLDPHTALTMLSIGTAFIPLVGPFISAGISLADAALYYKEGNTKTAGMVGLFACIPGIGGLATKLGLTKWGSKALGEIGKKVSLGSKLTKAELDVANKVAANKNLIVSEVSKVAAKQGVKATVIQGLKNAALKGTKSAVTYGLAGAAYSSSYDALQKNTPKFKSESAGLNWNFVKSAFGSSGTAQENTLLNQAWDKGWRPGKIVPKEYQTKLYQTNYTTEVENINKLNTVISQVKT